MITVITGGLRCGLLSLYHLVKKMRLKTSLTLDFDNKFLDNLQKDGSIIFSPYLLYEWENVKDLLRVAKDLRLVVILRKPDERAFSLWKSNLMYGLEFKSDFEEALQIENKRFYSSKFKDATGVNFWRYIYFRGGLYSFFLEKLEGPHRDVKVLTYEGIFSKGGIRNIFDFLGISADVNRLKVPHLGKSLVPAVPQIQFVLRRIGDGVFPALPMYKKLSAFLMKLNLISGRTRIYHWCVDFLKEAYRFEIEKLNKMGIEIID